jgi:hypothetical protein
MPDLPDAMRNEKMELATFWEGPVSALEKACLLSFTNRGHSVTFYSFTQQHLDPAIKWRPAGDILDASYLPRFLTDGKPNIASFSDLFRVVLFQKTDAIWIDCDVLATGQNTTPWPEEVLVKEGDKHIISCVLRINDQKKLVDIVRATDAFLDRDVPWAAMQYVVPKVLFTPGSNHVISPESEFCPFGADEWFKLLLPEYKDECVARAASARTLHLYNNILQKVGYHKDVAPPKDSYLHAVLAEEQLLNLFTGIYSAETVRNLSEGWSLRFSARQAGFGALARQLVPSMRRTLARRAIR